MGQLHVGLRGCWWVAASQSANGHTALEGGSFLWTARVEQWTKLGHSGAIAERGLGVDRTMGTAFYNGRRGLKPR